MSSRIVILSGKSAVYHIPLSRNVIFLSKQNPHCLTEMVDHPPHVMTWKGVTSSHITGPNFSDGTLTGVPYLEQFRNYIRAYQQTDHGTGVVPAK